VRILVLLDQDNDLPFAMQALLTFADSVKCVEVGAAGTTEVVANGTELLVIPRGAWKTRDTDLCARMYGARLGVPCLCVSGPAPLADRSGALKAGADDFLHIPFEIDELVARAVALVRRSSSGPRHVRAGVFVVDFARRQVFVEGQTVSMTLHEYDVLAALIEHAGEVVTRQELAARTSSVAAPESNIVDVHVSHIREKLGAHAGAIETVRGVGYRFRARP
jgi:DNA-binding response OmpR family regulator